VLDVGSAVAGVEEGPFLGPDFLAAQDAKRDAGVGDLAPFLADFLAFGLGEAGQEIVEIPVAGVAPVKLHAVAEFQPGVSQPAGFFGIRKEHVEGGGAGLAHFLQHLPDQRLPACRVATENARAGDGRERHGRQPLGVVVQPVAPVGVGPGPVEHVFAVGVALEIQRHGGHQACRLPTAQRGAAPSRCGGRRSRMFRALPERRGTSRAGRRRGRSIDRRGSRRGRSGGGSLAWARTGWVRPGCYTLAV
jgi:hypothetical protein